MKNLCFNCCSKFKAEGAFMCPDCAAAANQVELPRYDPGAFHDPNDRLTRLRRRRERLLALPIKGDELEQVEAQIAAEEIWG